VKKVIIIYIIKYFWKKILIYFNILKENPCLPNPCKPGTVCQIFGNAGFACI
jgi:hypothetical protein